MDRLQQPARDGRQTRAQPHRDERSDAQPSDARIAAGPRRPAQPASAADGVRALGRRQPRCAAGRHAPSPLRAPGGARPARRHLCRSAQRRLRRLAPSDSCDRRALARIWRGLRREDVFPVSARTMLGGLTGQRDHLFPDRGLSRSSVLTSRSNGSSMHRSRYTSSPSTCSAETRFRLSHGPAIDAVLAADSHPRAAAPRPLGDRLLSTEGWSTTRRSRTRWSSGAERVFVLPPSSARCAPADAPRGALDAAIHGLTLLVGARLEARHRALQR